MKVGGAHFDHIVALTVNFSAANFSDVQILSRYVNPQIASSDQYCILRASSFIDLMFET